MEEYCRFMYDHPEYAETLTDVRGFKPGDRVCVRNPDNPREIKFGIYKGIEKREIPEENRKNKDVKSYVTFHYVQIVGKKYTSDRHATKLLFIDVGEYIPKQPAKKGGRTRRNRRRKATRRYSSYSSNKISTFSAHR